MHYKDLTYYKLRGQKCYHCNEYIIPRDQWEIREIGKDEELADGAFAGMGVGESKYIIWATQGARVVRWGWGLGRPRGDGSKITYC